MAHPDFDRLLAELLPFAERMLLQYGEFYPFAKSMSLVGEIRDVGGWDGNEHPSSSDLIRFLVDGLRHQAELGIIRAYGICLNVRARKSEDALMTDAICCRLEHVNGEAVAVFIPYHKTPTTEVFYGNLWANLSKAEVFIH
jgi:hypothetical protein